MSVTDKGKALSVYDASNAVVFMHECVHNRKDVLLLEDSEPKLQHSTSLNRICRYIIRFSPSNHCSMCINVVVCFTEFQDMILTLWGYGGNY